MTEKTMVRLGRAVVASEQKDWDVEAHMWDEDMLRFHGIWDNVRAVLQALQEPDEGMVKAAKGCREGILEDANTRRTWKAMLFHILEESS